MHDEKIGSVEIWTSMNPCFAILPFEKTVFGGTQLVVYFSIARVRKN